MGVARREAAAVVDAGVVAVAPGPAREHDRPRGGRVDRSSVGNADVDSGMEASPAVAERARYGSVYRPDQALRRRNAVRRTVLGGGQPPTDARVLGGERIRLGNPLPFLLAGGGELTLLLASLVRERVLACQQLVTDTPLLLGAHGDDLRLRVDAGANDLRPLAGDFHLVSRSAYSSRDVLVLFRDRLQIVDSVERVLERVGFEDHLDERRVLRLVDVDHPQVQLVNDRCVFLAEEVQPFGLELEQLVEAIEPALVQREVLLQGRKLLRDVHDLPLQRPDVRRDARALRRQTRLLRARGCDARLEVADLPAVVAGRRRGEDEAGSEDDRQSADHERKVRQGTGRPCRNGLSYAPPRAPAREPTAPAPG